MTHLMPVDLDAIVDQSNITAMLIGAMQRIANEAGPLAKNCPPAPHSCHACEILFVAREAISKATTYTT